MSLTVDSIFSLLATAQFGAYAVSLDQTIVFWNRAAERILGFRAHDVLGLHCYEVFSGATPGVENGDCRQGCPSLIALREGRLPSQMAMQMVSASNQLKSVLLTPAVIAGTDGRTPVIVHFFTDDSTSDVSDSESTPRPVGVAGSHRPAARLTKRELEVLRLVSSGWETPRIANELNISPHTVLNHIRHFRRKLGAPTKLDAVVSAIRMGILPID